MTAAGCGKYSVANLKGVKAFKDANAAYQAKDYKKAVERYEAVVANDTALQTSPTLNTAYFFLANSYDNMYRSARRGDAANDAFMGKAVEYYKKDAQIDPDPKMKKLSLQYLVAAYGPDKLNDPTQQSSRFNPGARLTIGKRISSRAYLTFSQSLTPQSTSRDQVILLEYDQSDRLSWVLSQNEDRTYALEMRVRHAF